MKDSLSLAHKNLLDAIERERASLPSLTLLELEEARLDTYEASSLSESFPCADDVGERLA